MERYKVYHSAMFDRELDKYDSYFKERVDKIESQLAENPYVGDPLNVKWFREKRIEGFRIYYLIYDSINSVFMVAISDKKDQQKTINTIRLMLDLFRNELNDIIDDESDST